MGTLFVVGTPIGNLEDLSERALGVLCQVDLIAAENPSRTHRLLARYDIDTPMMRYTDAYDRKKASRMHAVLAALDTGDVALVSEAGMPGLADPGYELVTAVLDQGVSVVAVPGPTALTAALSITAAPGHRFIFLGFLPRRNSARRDLLAQHADRPFPLVAYEAPHRLLETLADLDRLLGNRPLVVASELTKMYEDVQRGTPAELLAYFRHHRPRGEFTLVIDAVPPPQPLQPAEQEGTAP
jgi:16S rRNA (cytidine1402-2'-O)-methyltransferase